MNNEIILTREDNNGELYADVGDIIKIILNEIGGTGYEWSIDGEIPKPLKRVLNDYKMTYKKMMGGSGKRVMEFVVIEKGEATINLKYWQEWNGDESIDKRFEVSIIVE